MDQARTFTIEDGRLIYRNFSGEPTPFNTKGGKKTFSVILDKPTADAMARDGWNVKCKIPEGEDAEEYCFIEVTVRFDLRPPKIVLITDTSKTRLTDETVGMLDYANIRTVDLIAREYQWDVGGKSGIKAYLQTMFVTIEEDELERKYAAIQQSEEG